MTGHFVRPPLIPYHKHWAISIKTGKGATIYLGKTLTSICPVSALLQYLAIQPKGDRPMLVSSSGKPITKRIFISKVRETLARAGVDTSSYKASTRA